MKPVTSERPLSQPWEEMDLRDPSTWTAQVEVEPGVYASVPVDQVAQLVAEGGRCRPRLNFPEKNA